LYRAMELMVETFYGTHPFHKPSLGYPETVEKISRGDLIDFYKKIFIPNNIVITAIGNFNEKEFTDYVKKNLGSMKKSHMAEIVKGEIPDRKAIQEKFEKRDTAASWFAMGWPSSTINDKDMYAMEVLNSITGGSMNSRLFIAIREKRGLAYQVSSFINARVSSGIYVAYIGTKPSSYEESRKVLAQEVEKMTIDKPSQEEVINSVNYLSGMNIMDMESNSGQATKYGKYEILGTGYEYIDKYNSEIKKITADDVLNAGKKYLSGPYAIGGVLVQ